MRRLRRAVRTGFVAAAVVAATLLGCLAQSDEPRKPTSTLFIGVDSRGSFRHSGHYDNAMSFLAH
jgi:hypothetical protein